jgi:hypothetical protein
MASSGQPTGAGTCDLVAGADALGHAAHVAVVDVPTRKIELYPGREAVDAGSRQFGDVASTFKQIANLVSTATDAAREIAGLVDA